MTYTMHVFGKKVGLGQLTALEELKRRESTVSFVIVISSFILIVLFIYEGMVD